ncbi:MAG: hypothetical protein PHG97_05785, partial [Candidatus Margulisbacteria bacterium]|nr:hypothetical protein [Candidatus Margulisiibacteriota bacterium]
MTNYVAAEGNVKFSYPVENTWKTSNRASIVKLDAVYEASPGTVIKVRINGKDYWIKAENGYIKILEKNAQGQFVEAPSSLRIDQLLAQLAKEINNPQAAQIIQAVIAKLAELSQGAGLNGRSIDLTALIDKVKADAGDKPNLIDKKAKEIAVIDNLNPELPILNADLDKLTADAKEADKPFNSEGTFEQRQAALEARKKTVNGRPADKAEPVATAGASQGLNVRLSSLEAKYRDAYGGDLPKETQEKIDGVRNNLQAVQKKVDAEEKALSSVTQKQNARVAAEDNLRALIDRLEGKGVFNSADQAILDGLRNKNNPDREILKASLNPNERILSFSKGGRTIYLVVEKKDDNQWHILTPGILVPQGSGYIDQNINGEPVAVKQRRSLSLGFGTIDFLAPDAKIPVTVVVEPINAKKTPADIKPKETSAWEAARQLNITNFEAFREAWKDEKIDRQEAQKLGITATWHNFIDRGSNTNRAAGDVDGVITLDELQAAVAAVKAYARAAGNGVEPTEAEILKAARS